MKIIKHLDGISSPTKQDHKIDELVDCVNRLSERLNTQNKKINELQNMLSEKDGREKRNCL